jgi:AraC-like DNA-binding protein
MTSSIDTGSKPIAGQPRSLEPALRHIDTHLGEPLRLQALAALCGLSLWRFATVFRQRLGVSPYRYVNQLRVRRAQELLSQGVPAARVASESGFYDQSHLGRRFKHACGMTPGQYQYEIQTQVSERST